MRTARTRTIARLLFLLAMAVPLCATSTARLDFGQLSRSADRIVAGRVTKINVSEDPSNGYLYSTVTLSVSRATPAQLAGREYSFRMIGGDLGNRSQYIADYPKLREGDNVVLFLNAETSGVFGPTVGLGQGVFFLNSDAQAGVERVMDRFGRPVLGIREQKLIRGVPRTNDSLPAAPSTTTKGRSAIGLDDFFSQIQTLRATNPLQGLADAAGR